MRDQFFGSGTGLGTDLPDKMKGPSHGLALKRVSAWLTPPPPPPPPPQGSPSSKRRGPLLQPIIEGETALFFDDIKVKSCCWYSCNHLRALSPPLPTSPHLSPPPMNPVASCWLDSCLFLATSACRDAESIAERSCCSGRSLIVPPAFELKGWANCQLPLSSTDRKADILLLPLMKQQASFSVSVLALS